MEPSELYKKSLCKYKNELTLHLTIMVISICVMSSSVPGYDAQDLNGPTNDIPLMEPEKHVSTKVEIRRHKKQKKVDVDHPPG